MQPKKKQEKLTPFYSRMSSNILNDMQKKADELGMTLCAYIRIYIEQAYKHGFDLKFDRKAS